jgi:hypothetical protein
MSERAPSGYETQSRDTLHKAMADAYAPVYRAGADYASSHKKAAGVTDIVETMAAMASTILAAEHLRDTADQAVKDMRAALAEQMDSVGCTKATDGAIVAYLSKKPSFLSIDDEAIIPRHFFVTKPPELDRKSLKAALEKSEIPGARIVVPNDMRLNVKVVSKE